MHNALVIDLSRENIGSLLDGGSEAPLRLVDAERALRQEVGRGEVRFGYWGERRRDPLPDFMIIRDDELVDTNAWLSAFLPGLAPISQWCRVLSGTTAARLAARVVSAEKEMLVGAWVGAILSEASLTLGRSSGIKDVPGLVAISSATYAASRAVYLWGHDAPLGEVSVRFEELTRRLGQGGRGHDLRRLLPLWNLLADFDGSTKVSSDGEVLQPFRHVISQVRENGLNTQSVRGHAKTVADYFGVPEIEICAVGPQSNRVSALDAVARRMVTGPRSVAIDAVLGFAASLIDPGVAVLPELLKRYNDHAPLAPIWTGAFAGIWAPMRVLLENGGLGRIIVKELTKSSDLHCKPSADIGYDELIRWVGGSGESRPRIRGLSASYINVEVVEGVSVPFSYNSDLNRHDLRSNFSTTSNQRSLDLRKSEELAVRQDSGSAARQPATSSPIDDIIKRLEVLERTVAATAAKAVKAGTRSVKK